MNQNQDRKVVSDNAQDAAEHVKDMAKKYGFIPDEDSVRGSVEESAEVLRLEMTEQDIVDACDLILGKIELPAVSAQKGKVVEPAIKGIIAKTQEATMADIKLQVSDNPLGWVFAEYSPGQRVLEKMVKFDCRDREDIQVNVHGVVLFYNTDTARMLLKDFVPPSEAAAKSKPKSQSCGMS